MSRSKEPVTVQAVPLKEACLTEALHVISNEGLEGLSLRAVARRLGVSHQAPYKHFGSRDGLLIAVIGRCLQQFADHLHRSGDGKTPEEAMAALGGAYMAYARQNWLEYRLMFSTPWPKAARAAGLDQEARAAFDVLCQRLGAVRPELTDAALDREAMFVWSAMHGIAGILASEAMTYLGLSEEEQDLALQHVMLRVENVIRGAIT